VSREGAGLEGRFSLWASVFTDIRAGQKALIKTQLGLFP